MRPRERETGEHDRNRERREIEVLYDSKPARKESQGTADCGRHRDVHREPGARGHGSNPYFDKRR